MPTVLQAGMHAQKVFTLEEAREILPHLRELFAAAHRDLGALHDRLTVANRDFEAAEKELEELTASTCSDGLTELRARRDRYQKSIENLSQVQRQYMERFETWVEKIAETGVHLRDMRDGLLDFPCRKDGFDFLLCWRLAEPDIQFWHLTTDGFVGRKPLATLIEYC